MEEQNETSLYDPMKHQSLIQITEETIIYSGKGFEIRKKDFRTIFYGDRWINDEILEGFCSLLRIKYYANSKRISIVPWEACYRPGKPLKNEKLEWKGNSRFFQKHISKTTEIIYFVMATGNHFILLRCSVIAAVIEYMDCLQNGAHRKYILEGLQIFQGFLTSSFQKEFAIVEIQEAHQIGKNYSHVFVRLHFQ